MAKISRLDIPIGKNTITLLDHWLIQERVLFNGKLVSKKWMRGFKSNHRFSVEQDGYHARYEVLVTTNWRGAIQCIIRQDGSEVHNQHYVFGAGGIVPKETPKPHQEQPEAVPQIDPARIRIWLTRQRQQQNLPIGIAAGLVATLAGSVVWVAITATTRYQIGWMAVFLGLGVGLCVQVFGQGVDRLFQIAAAGLALLGCLFGNLLITLIYMAPIEGIPVFGLLFRLTPYGYYWVLSQGFQVIDLLFYWLAVQAAYSSSIKRYHEPATALPEPKPARI